MSARPAEGPPVLTACIQGIGLIGPGLADWRSGARVIAGEAGYSPRPTAVPAAEGLPAAERRRTSATVRLGLGVAQQAVAAAGIDPTTLLAVFSSSNGDGAICHEICETLACADRQLSPTRFHNSVHNATAGYWGLATGSTAASTALCAYDGSFAAGLLEALGFVSVDRVPVLLSAYETPYPEPLHSKRPIPDAFGVALVLTPTATHNDDAELAAGGSTRPAGGHTLRPAAERTARPIARLAARLRDATGTDRLSEPRLEALRQAVPAARSLPLLRLLARREPGEVLLDYIDGKCLAVEVSACR